MRSTDINAMTYITTRYFLISEEHIVNSRDISGTDVILNATKGQGVNLMICSVRGEMKNVSKNTEIVNFFILLGLQISLWSA